MTPYAYPLVVFVLTALCVFSFTWVHVRGLEIKRKDAQLRDERKVRISCEQWLAAHGVGIKTNGRLRHTEDF